MMQLLAMRLTPCCNLVRMKANPLIIKIDDANDPRLAPYRDIKERDLVRNQRQFIAEGKTVLQALLNQHRFSIASLLVLENRLAGINEIIAKLPAETPIYVAGKAIMDQVAGFPMHRGVLGIANAPTSINNKPDETEAAKWQRVLVMVGLSNHDNVGSIFRNAAAFNVDAILLDRQTCDPLYRKAIRVSVGGVFRVPYFELDSASQIIGWLTDQKFETIALSPQGQVNLMDWQPGVKTAILLGTEGEGLPSDLLHALKSVRVEMSDTFDSLNVATTSGIVLHHLVIRQKAV